MPWWRIIKYVLCFGFLFFIHISKRKQKQGEFSAGFSVKLFYLSLTSTSIRIKYYHVFSENFAYNCITVLISSESFLFSNVCFLQQTVAPRDQRKMVFILILHVIDHHYLSAKRIKFYIWAFQKMGFSSNYNKKSQKFRLERPKFWSNVSVNVRNLSIAFLEKCFMQVTV